MPHTPSGTSAPRRRPVIVGIGGTVRENSTSERALRYCLAAAARLGAETIAFTGRKLVMPMFEPGPGESAAAAELVAALRRCDGVLIASPGYHGSISGLIKNALDYTEYMSGDARPYFDGRAVGCIATAAGWQAASNTLAALRSIIHALRGWNTPMGVVINSSQPLFDEAAGCNDPKLAVQLDTMTEQVIAFARQQMASKAAAR